MRYHTPNMMKLHRQPKKKTVIPKIESKKLVKVETEIGIFNRLWHFVRNFFRRFTKL